MVMEVPGNFLTDGLDLFELVQPYFINNKKNYSTDDQGESNFFACPPEWTSYMNLHGGFLGI